jgi:hypothetical protein
MTSKARLIAALTGQPVDRLPFSPFLAYVWEFFPPAVQQAGPLAFHHRIGADPLWRGAPCPVGYAATDAVTSTTFTQDDRQVTVISTPVGELRMASKRSEAGGTHFLVEHPLKTADDFKVQTWIEEQAVLVRTPEAVAAHFAGDGREGLSLGMLIPRMKSAYQSLVEYHVGTEELVYAQADFPDAVDTLWQTMVAKDLEAVRLAADADYDYFITWEDSSTQNYSPALYDRYIAAEITQWCALVRAQGKQYIQHACGHVRALLHPMLDAGVMAVESLSPYPTGNLSLAEARALAGPGFGIIGGIEPTQFLRLSLRDLGPYVEEVIADGQGGPFVLANSDSCPPGVTVEKFELVADIARGVRPGV